VAEIFVDANIILGFWSLSDGRVPSQLLLPLVGLRSHLLVTAQVVDEVNRNKLGMFLRNSGQFSISLPPEFPDHFIGSREVNELNETVKSLKKTEKKAREEWECVRGKIAKQISSNDDLTSSMLRPLFDAAVRPDEKQLQAARDRRERGNPPGKRTDPLGDQISWQQFLDAAKGKQRVWIISRDGDFTETVNKQALLDPFLQAELTERGVKNIEIYDNLTSAIKSLKSAGLLDPKELGDLDEKKLNELEMEEARSYVPQPPYFLWPNTPWTCPSCHQMNAADSVAAHPSQYGGWSYWAKCRHCGHQFDTGEPYED
jgi:hypothetical protein